MKQTLEQIKRSAEMWGGTIERIEVVIHRFGTALSNDAPLFCINSIKGRRITNEFLHCGLELIEHLDSHTEARGLNDICLDSLAIGESARVTGFFATDADPLRAKSDDHIDFFNLEWVKI